MEQQLNRAARRRANRPAPWDSSAIEAHETGVVPVAIATAPGRKKTKVFLSRLVVVPSPNVGVRPSKPVDDITVYDSLRMLKAKQKRQRRNQKRSSNG